MEIVIIGHKDDVRVAAIIILLTLSNKPNATIQFHPTTKRNDVIITVDKESNSYPPIHKIANPYANLPDIGCYIPTPERGVIPNKYQPKHNRRR